MRLLNLVVVISCIASAVTIAAGRDVPALPDVPHIVVVGTGAAEAEADYLELSIGVTISRPGGEEARAVVEETLLAVVNALLDMELDQEQIVVGAMNLEMVYDYDDEPPRRTLAQASRSIHVTLHDMDAFDAVVRSAIENGATGVSRPRLRSNEEESLRQQAQDRAFQHARESAERVARGLGRSLGPVYSAATDDARSWGWGRGGGLFGSPGADVGRITSLKFTARPVAETASVYTVFLLGPPLVDDAQPQ